MPKRKAPDEDLQAEEASTTPKKKSKKEMAKEARAKAKAWHDARNAAKSSFDLATVWNTVGMEAACLEKLPCPSTFMVSKLAPAAMAMGLNASRRLLSHSISRAPLS